jgi:hypothetical protein
VRPNTIEAPAPAPGRQSAPADYDQTTVGRVGRMAMTGALVGALVLGVVVTLVTYLATADSGQALGVGVAVALTGGPFFGGLTGFAMAVHEAESAAASAAPTGTV